MNDLKNIKEKQINDYISNMMLDDSSIDIDKMKNDLSILIGEKPGIELEYKTEQLIVEDGTEPIKKEKLDSIIIYYTYEENNMLRFGNLKYLTD
jgi:hypothetical protein